MPEDGIDFAEYESPEDDPIPPRFFNKIAEGVQKLITKYDFAYSRLQESVNECDDGLCRQIAAEVKWRRTRERYAQCYITQHQSRNKPARCPGPQYHFEVISLTDRTHSPIKGRVGPDICVWFPRKLWLRDCPRVDWPLPLKDGEMERYEKETILAAIYDCHTKGERKIADGLNLEHYDKVTGLESSESTQGGIKQIPAKHLRHLERWLKQFEEDLHTYAEKSASVVQDGRNAPTPAVRTEEAAGGAKVTPAVDQTEPPDQFSNPPNSQDRYTFRPDGDVWLLEFGEERGHVKNLKGFSIVHTLLSSPNKPISVSILGGQQSEGTAKQPIRDGKWLAGVKQKLDEYDDDIARAEASGDVTTADVLRRERQEIKDQLVAASALRGKSRTFKDDYELVRNRVSKQISNISERLQQCDPPLPKLAVHLMRSIVPQAGCYTYQPEQHVTWKLG